MTPEPINAAKVNLTQRVVLSIGKPIDRVGEVDVAAAVYRQVIRAVESLAVPAIRQRDFAAAMSE